MKSILHFLDKLEDKVRGRLSRYPIIYAVIGGSAIILFWRGIWHVADDFERVYSLSNLEGALISLVLGAGVLLITGLFSSFFVGDSILISGLRHEKKMIEKTEEEIELEVSILKRLQGELSRGESISGEIKKELSEIRGRLDRLEKEKK